MTTPATPSQPTPAGDDRNLVAVDAATAASFEDKVQLWWKNYRTGVTVICVAIVVGIVGKGGWDYMARQKDMEVGKAYVAATTPEQLKAFAAAHAGHSLAGIAQIRIADEAYKAGKAADAVAAYETAVTALGNSPLAARALVGRALAKIQSGKAADGVADLKKLADDANQLKAIRAEAAYSLTSLAVEAGNATEAQKWVDQLGQIDPVSPWTQRAMGIRATLPATPAPAAAAAPAAGETPSTVQVKLPGK